MRPLFLFLSLSILPFFVQAQRYAELPNNEFNTWDADGYSPSGWVTVESIFSADYSMVDEETTDKVNGSASATLTTNDFGMGPFYSLMSCGTGRYSTSPSGVLLQGISYTDTPASVWILYKSKPVEKDTPGFLINLYQSRSGVQEGVLQRAFYLSPAAEWRLSKIDLRSRYLKKELPDSIVFTFYSSITKIANRKIGTKLQVDGVYFNEPAALGLEDQETGNKDFTLYPNPGTGKAVRLRSGVNATGLHFEWHGFDGIQRKKVLLRNDFSNEINTDDLLPGAYLWIITDAQGKILSKGKYILTP